ncbi:MAG: DoxX family protein [Flammeovirgaceae bacterium]|nr:DoxX family protein [Flammeovirgaceae bacterium]
MNTQLRPGTLNFSLLFLRVSIGGMMLTHGYGKFLRLMEGNLKFTDPIGIGSELSFVLVVLAEFFAAIALIFGFWTRINAFLLSFTMFVAAFVRHADDPFSKQEKPLMFLAVFLALMFMGGGKHSIDDKIN